MTAFTFTLNLRALKAVAIAAGTEETRYYLNGVNLEYTADGVVMVATDGHRAIVLRQSNFDVRPHGPFPSVIIPLAFINKIKLVRNLDVADITLGAEGSISIRYAGETMGTNAIDGTFPGWRRLVPAATKMGETAQYNPAYVADFHKAGKLLAKDARAPVIMHDGGSPALVSFYWGEKEGLDAFGILMPIRTPDAYVKSAPAWASTYHAKPEPVAAPDAGQIGLDAVAKALEGAQ